MCPRKRIVSISPLQHRRYTLTAFFKDADQVNLITSIHIEKGSAELQDHAEFFTRETAQSSPSPMELAELVEAPLPQRLSVTPFNKPSNISPTPWRAVNCFAKLIGHSADI